MRRQNKDSTVVTTCPPKRTTAWHGSNKYSQGAAMRSRKKSRFVSQRTTGSQVKTWKPGDRPSEHFLGLVVRQCGEIYAVDFDQPPTDLDANVFRKAPGLESVDHETAQVPVVDAEGACAEGLLRQLGVFGGCLKDNHKLSLRV